MGDLRALAESLGWKVWSYKKAPPVTSEDSLFVEIQEFVYALRAASRVIFQNDSAANAYVQRQEFTYILRAPNGAIFQNGSVVDDYIQSQDIFFNFITTRPTEADAWNDLSKTEAEIRAYSR